MKTLTFNSKLLLIMGILFLAKTCNAAVCSTECSNAFVTECYPIFKNLYQTNIIAYTTCRNIINNQPDVAKVKCPDASCTDTAEMTALKTD